jgi:hypothetical protein
LWLPALFVVLTSAFGRPKTASVDVVTTRGWHLVTPPATAARIDGIRTTLQRIAADGGHGPVIFYPSGAGFYVAYDIEPPERTVWFFPHAVRPYEIPSLTHEFKRASALVSCNETRLFQPDFPSSLVEVLTTRLRGPLWQDDVCRVFGLRD